MTDYIYEEDDLDYAEELIKVGQFLLLHMMTIAQVLAYFLLPRWGEIGK